MVSTPEFFLRSEPLVAEVSLDVPEHRLMLALLEDAVVVFRDGVLSSDPMRRKEYFEVGRWIHERDSDFVFSFENVCRTLRLDPDYIRGGLAELKRQAMGAARSKPKFRIHRTAGSRFRNRRRANSCAHESETHSALG